MDISSWLFWACAPVHVLPPSQLPLRLAYKLQLTADPAGMNTASETRPAWIRDGKERKGKKMKREFMMPIPLLVLCAIRVVKRRACML